MGTAIASQFAVKAIARNAQCTQRLIEGGLDIEALQLVIDEPEARQRLIKFWQLLCRQKQGGESFSPLLTFAGTVPTHSPGPFMCFRAIDRFVRNTESPGKEEVLIHDVIGTGFAFWFSNYWLDGKDHSVSYYDVRHSCTGHKEIMDQAGGEAHCHITLGAVWQLLTKQPRGQKKGPLLVDGKDNYFYVRISDDETRLVSATWTAHGWVISACFPFAGELFGAGRLFCSDF